MKRILKKSISVAGHHVKPSVNTIKPNRLFGKIVLGIVALIVFILVNIGISLVIFSVGYQPAKPNLELIANNPKTIVDYPEYISILGNSQSNKILIFYPGAGVQPKSYTTMLYGLKNEFRHILITKFPANLAVLEPTKGNKITDQFKKDFNVENSYIQQFDIVLAGHSLGGAMLSEYYKNSDYKNQITGVIFMGAYPADYSIDQKKVRALFVYGSQDGLIKTEKLNDSKRLWPTSTFTEKPGMNHAQWGEYGKQNGDKDSLIDYVTIQEQVSQIISNWINLPTK